MFVIAKKGYKRRNCRSWLVEWTQDSSVLKKRQFCEFPVADHMFKKREFVGFRFWSWEKKNYLAGKVPWSWRWLHFGWNSLHFQCVDPCKFVKLGKLVCVICEWRNCIYIPPFTRIKLSVAFIWSLSCWPGEMAQQLRVLTTLVDDLGLFLSTHLVAYNCHILNNSSRGSSCFF